MHYFKPNSKQAIKLAIAIKSITGSIGASTWIGGHDTIALCIFLVGAIANEAVNFFSDGTNETLKEENKLPDFKLTPPPPDKP